VRHTKLKGSWNVGKPTDFVSHAWRNNFYHFVGALEKEHVDRELEAERTGEVLTKRYYWNDVFVEDENNANSKPPGYFFTAFRDAVEKIGRTIFVWEPLEAAIPLTRAWCIWEIFCTIDSNSDLVVALPPDEHTKFQHMIMDDFGKLVEYVMQVNSEKSDAFSSEDKQKIHNVVRERCKNGFHTVDKIVCQGLQKWLADSARRMIEQPSQDDSLPKKKKSGNKSKDFKAKESPMQKQKKRIEKIEKKNSMKNQVAKLYQQQGKLNDAEKLFRQVYESRSKTFSVRMSRNGHQTKVDLVSTVTAANNLAQVLNVRGGNKDIKEAQIILHKCIEDCKKHTQIGETHEHT